MNTYIHKTEQRLRIRSDFIRNNPIVVSKLIDDLDKIEAIHKIKYKKYAGSVALSFDNSELDCKSLLEILESHDWLEQSDKPSIVQSAVSKGTKALTRGVTGVALRYVLGASVGGVIMGL